jgi:hypothetical protein
MRSPAAALPGDVDIGHWRAGEQIFAPIPRERAILADNAPSGAAALTDLCDAPYNYSNNRKLLFAA